MRLPLISTSRALPSIVSRKFTQAYGLLEQAPEGFRSIRHGLSQSWQTVQRSTRKLATWSLANFMWSTPALAKTFSETAHDNPDLIFYGTLFLITGSLASACRYGWMHSLQIEAQEQKNRLAYRRTYESRIIEDINVVDSHQGSSIAERGSKLLQVNDLDASTLTQTMSQEDGFALLEYLLIHCRETYDINKVFQQMLQIDEQQAVRSIENLAIMTTSEDILRECLEILRTLKTPRSHRAIANIAENARYQEHRDIVLFMVTSCLPKDEALATLFVAVYNDIYMCNKKSALMELAKLGHMSVCACLKLIAADHPDREIRLMAIQYLMDNYPDNVAAFLVGRYVLDRVLDIKENILQLLGTSPNLSAQAAYEELRLFMKTPREKFLYELYLGLRDEKTKREKGDPVAYEN